MNQLEDRLSDLLHRSVPPTRPLAYEPVVRLAGTVRRKRRRQVLAAGALALIGLGVGLGFVLLAGGSDAGREELTTRPTPTATPSPTASGDVVRQGGLTYAVPPGWKRQLTAFCGPQPTKTVAGAFTPVERCLARTSGPSAPSVQLGPIWTEGGSGSWAGKPIDWQGQPAYLDTAVTTGVPGEVVEVLSFPLLNASVMAVAPDAAEARALLDRVTARVSALPIPKDVFSIRIVRRNAFQPQSQPVVIADPAVISTFVADLRQSAKAPAKPTCVSGWAVTPTVITLHSNDGTDVSYLTSPDRCPVLTAGTGAAVTASAALIADINRYVPANLNLPPDPSVTVPICHTSQLTGSYGGSVSPQTQEHSAIVNLRNDGGACQVFGYPFVDVFDDAGQIAAITQNGGGYVQEAPDVTVLQPGQSVHVVLAASACGTTAETVTRVQVTLRGNIPPVIVSWPDNGSAGLQICPGYNGALVQVGPLVAGAAHGQ